MNELALFAGSGGGILGSVLLGHRVVAAVELDPYCREVLLRRQEEGHLEPFPIWDDITTFDGGPWRGLVDVVSAGFPCQPFSSAGKRLGPEDDRNLWPDTIRVIREVAPRVAFLENVPGLVRTDYFGEILGDLAEAGFNAEWTVVSAGELGAPHRRDRLWVLAYANGNDVSNRLFPKVKNQGGIQSPNRNDTAEPMANGSEGTMADAEGQRLEDRFRPTGSTSFSGSSLCGWWLTEPGMGRVADGVAYRVDRFKALGNGQVPRVVAEAWERLI